MWRIQLLYTTFKWIPINFGVLKIGWHMKYIASRNENVTTNFVMPNAKKNPYPYSVSRWKYILALPLASSQIDDISCTGGYLIQGGTGQADISFIWKRA